MGRSGFAGGFGFWVRARVVMEGLIIALRHEKGAKIRGIYWYKV